MARVARSLSGHRCGESHQRARLSDAQVRDIRARYVAYVVSYGRLAREFGCAESTIRDIVTFRTRVSA